MLLSLILYGSRARGDHRLRSDVDLLGIIEGGLIHKEVTKRGASFYHYPAPTLMEKSRAGDLFLLHLVEEGQVLHDTMNIFDQVRDAFRFRDSYEDVIQEAHLILRFLHSRPSLLQGRKPRKRLVWAIRTILIARCAEQKRSCFASSVLEKESELNGLKALIDGRNTAAISDLLAAADYIAKRFGSIEVEKSWPSQPLTQRSLLISAGGLAKDTTTFARTLKSRTLVSAPEVDLPYE